MQEETSSASSGIDGLPRQPLADLRGRFPGAYFIHFGSSQRSRFYPQALALCSQTLCHVEHGSESSRWHSVAVAHEDLDLLARLYDLARRLHGPRLLGEDALSIALSCSHGELYARGGASRARARRVIDAAQTLSSIMGLGCQAVGNYIRRSVLDQVQEDLRQVRERLQAEGFIDRMEPDGVTLVKAWRKPRETHPGLSAVRAAVETGNLEAAIAEYYSMLGDQPYGELTPELLYMKRLSNTELSGRDLLYFLPPSSMSPLVAEHVREYAACLDAAILDRQGTSRLVAILQRESPTMAALVEETQAEITSSVWLDDGIFTRDTTTRVDGDFFGVTYGHVLAGRIFDHYPDQVTLCNRFDKTEDPKYLQFWVTYPSGFLEREVVAKGLHLAQIDAYRHKGWTWRGKRGTREPCFSAAQTLADVEKSRYGLNHIRYTGRTHRIGSINFYEADLVRYVQGDLLENEFMDAVQDVLRSAENALREQHGLPRIGEGWISEMLLFDVVRAFFPDAEHHSTPDWLKRQHLDVYVPSSKLAFEFQGLQHYEPVSFFGGEAGYADLQKRDKVKARKCRENGVTLIAWKYDKPLSADALLSTLKDLNCQLPAVAHGP